MKKRILSLILAIAMVASIFAGIAVTASAAEGNYVLTDAPAVGDVVILASADGTRVFTGIGGTAQKPIGSAAEAALVNGVLTSAEAAALTIEAGSAEGSFAFKMEDGMYLGWKSGNYLYAMDAVSDETSWIVTYEEGVATVQNVLDSARKLQYNSGSPRFCAYTSAQKPVAFYKLSDVEVCTHEETTTEIVVAATCTTDGEQTVTCNACGYAVTEVIEATGHVLEGDTCTVCGYVKVNVSFEKITNLVIGDQIVILTEKTGNELVSVGTSFGSGAPYAETGIAGTYVLNVVGGIAEGTFAFVNEGNYLTWKKGANSLILSEELADLSSWKVSFDENGNAVMLNAADETRQLWWNNTNPRFACYAGKNEDAQYHTVQFYAVVADGVCRHTEATGEITTAATCTEAGVMTYTCTCGHTWTEAIAALGHTFGEGVVTTAATCTVAGVMTYTCTACGATKEEAIAVIDHDYVDGVCTICGETEPETAKFELIDLETIVEGNYVIAAVLGDQYPTVYPATSKITTGSNFDWAVSATAVTANEDVISADALPEDATVFAFKGNNTDGFTISYVAEGVEKFLGYTTTDSNRRLAFGEEYATTLWTVVADSDGGFALSSAFEGGEYVISQNSTNAGSAIRGYKTGAIYTGIYLFADAKGEAAPKCEHTNTSEIAAVEATCTTDGNTAGVKCDDCGEIISGYETVPAFGHDKAVTVVDGVIKTVCANCGEAEEITLNTIAEAKAYTDNTVVYNVKGVVTYAVGRNVYIQDGNDAVCVYFAYDFDTSGINVGDEIFVSSTMTTYKGLVELNLPKEYFVLSTGNAVEAQIVDLATLVTDSTNEYLGEKVTVKGATITDIASNGSVTLDQNGTTIIIYKAPALNEDCVVGAIVDVTAVVSTFNGYQLLIQDASAVVVAAAEECAHTNITVLEAVAATCTETGLTEGAKCADCGEITVAQEVVPALGHNEETVDNGNGTHTTTCANCGESTTDNCTYVDGVCSECGAKEPVSEPTLVPGIKLGHTLNLASDISINYGVLMSTLADYDSFYVEAVIPTYVGNEKTGTTTVTIQPTVYQMFYYFTLTGITAIQMNDKIEATLYMVKGDEIFVSATDVYSIGTYAYNQLNKTTVAEDLKHLCADLLRYGSYAQLYKEYRTDALVDAAMTDAMKAYLSDMEGVTFNNNKSDLGDFENPGAKWMGRSLNLDSKVVVKFIFALVDTSINVEDLTAEITYENYKGEVVTVTVGNAELYNSSLGYYAFSFDSLLAAELRTVMNAVIYNGETRVSSTLTYSVDTYGNGKTGALLDVCKALIAYSDTALAYFNK